MFGHGGDRTVDFEKVWSDELDAIQSRRRQSRYDQPKHESARERARQSQLVGLALSGGGIRSATFCLGVLQSLASFGYLRRVDYLSTVSGGGYIGSWLTAWCRRCGGIEEVEARLAEDPTERGGAADPPEIDFLRGHSNYLTPRRGLMSLDTWALAATYLRNLLNHFLLVALLFVTLFILPRVAGELFHLAGSDWAFFVACALILIAIILVARNLDNLLAERRTRVKGAARAERKGSGVYVAPIAYVGIWLLAAWLWGTRMEASQVEPQWAIGIGIIYALTWPAGWLFIQIARLVVGEAAASPESVPWPAAMKRAAWKVIEPRKPWMGTMRRAAIDFVPVVITAFLAGSAGGYLLFALRGWFNDWPLFVWAGAACPGTGEADRAACVAAWEAVSFGPVLVALVVGLSVAVHIGMAGRAFSQEAREWWSRLTASLMRLMLLVAGLSVLAIQGPWLLDWLGETIRWALGSGWLITTIGGFAVGRSSAVKLVKPGLLSRLLIRITPYVFIIGLLLILAWLARELLMILADETAFARIRGFLAAHGALPLHGGLQHDAYLKGTEWSLALYLAVLTFLWSWRVGINRFSLEELYRHRLVRCYLGASNDKRQAESFTGFDPADDEFNLADLVEPVETVPGKETGRPHRLYGPYHIINATLNLTAGARLAWQTRKGASFILSPLYVGYECAKSPRDGHLAGHGYLPSAIPASTSETEGLSLGDSLAVSGAAVTPGMGHYSTPAWTFLLSIFNLRLGRWLGNPRNLATCRRSGPRTGLFYLIVEMLGLATDRRGYVYLSDGGHFENLGIYELVRRECRFIIACDAEHDPEHNLSGLGNAIERCRTDFHVDIDIDVEHVRPDPDTGRSSRHCAIGRICYSQRDRNAIDGILVYLKASMTGDEPEDLTRYRAANPVFPHQATGDQWFDESQFESYRVLGAHIAQEVFGSVPEVSENESIEMFFLKLRERWYAPSTVARQGSAKHMETLGKLIKTLRTSPDVSFLDAQLYPSVGRLGSEHAFQCETEKYWLPHSQRELRAGFYLCKEMITFMEGVFHDLHLEDEYDHPDCRGWMNLFSRWWWSRMFRFTWAVTVSAYGSRFQTFCEQRLDFSPGKVVLGRYDEQPALELSPAVLADKDAAKEFWDGNQSRFGVNYFEARLINAFVVNNAVECRLIPLCMEVAHDPAEDDSSFRVNFGFALLRRCSDDPSSEALAYYRVQSHLRNTGLGRRGLLALLKEKNHAGLRFEPGELPAGEYEVATPHAIQRLRQQFLSAKREQAESMDTDGRTVSSA